MKMCVGIVGVEDVIADSKTHKVVVKGKKVAADPTKVVEYVQKKTGLKVGLLTPIPLPLEEKKEEERKEGPEPPKPEEKDEVNKITLVQTSCNIHPAMPLATSHFSIFIIIFLHHRLLECLLIPFILSFKSSVIQVVLKVHIHCEVCAQWIRMRILKMKGAY
jgi:hypothetical protein